GAVAGPLAAGPEPEPLPAPRRGVHRPAARGPPPRRLRRPARTARPRPAVGPRPARRDGRRRLHQRPARPHLLPVLHREVTPPRVSQPRESSFPPSWNITGGV